MASFFHKLTTLGPILVNENEMISTRPLLDQIGWNHAGNSLRFIQLLAPGSCDNQNPLAFQAEGVLQLPATVRPSVVFTLYAQ